MTTSGPIDTSKPTNPPPTTKPTSGPTNPPPTTKPTSGPTNPPPTTKPTSGPTYPPTTTKPTSGPTIPDPASPPPNEFNINTVPNELSRITVVQNSYDQTKLNNQNITTNFTRQSNYDIYIIKEEDPTEEEKSFYSKMYTGAISIASECIVNSGEKCVLNEMVDLSKIKQDKSKIRALEDENINLKDTPLATCIFKITDSDFITSIKCHEKFPEEKKNEMILDLYFFRAPAIKRRNKERDNITISITDDLKENKKHIREQNGGLCNIYNNWGSLCTTDMNITTDLDGNFISYDEMAITNIYYDDANSFVKEKKSSLVDNTGKITREEKDEYRDNLKKLLNKL